MACYAQNPKYLQQLVKEENYRQLTNLAFIIKLHQAFLLGLKQTGRPDYCLWAFRQ